MIIRREKIKGLKAPIKSEIEKKKATACNLKWIGNISEIVRWALLAAGEATRKTRIHKRL